MPRIFQPFVNPTWYRGVFLVCLVFLLGACDVPQAVVERAPAGEILFQDDFSQSTSGWDQVVAESGATHSVDDSYRIWVNETYTDLWANPGLRFDDTRSLVEATMTGGPDDNVFGLICRSNSSGEQYYYFIVSSDGYFGIGKVNGQDQVLLTGSKLLPSEAILQGKKTNLLQAECIKDRLIFYVNGQKLAEVQDSDFSAGDIGLTAGTFDKPGVDIRFDNLKVIKP